MGAVAPVALHFAMVPCSNSTRVLWCVVGATIMMFFPSSFKANLLACSYYGLVVKLSSPSTRRLSSGTYLSKSLILFVSSDFFYFSSLRRCRQFYVQRHPWVLAYQAVITFFVIANFTMATFMDPGVIPKGEFLFAWFSKVIKSYRNYGVIGCFFSCSVDWVDHSTRRLRFVNSKVKISNGSCKD